MSAEASCLEKKISVRKIKAELLKQYVMSLKEVVCKYRGQIEMECNSENTSDANGEINCDTVLITIVRLYFSNSFKSVRI